MLKIAITPPFIYPGEAEVIAAKLQSQRADYVHIRKPECKADEVDALINAVPAELRGRLTLHDHFQLAPLVGGVHLNTRNRQSPAGWKGRVSASLHSFSEVQKECRRLDYVTLSPIFNSISKPGYSAAFDAKELQNFLALPRRFKIIALGGVNSSNSDRVESMGFDGYAMLGAAWRREFLPAQFRLQFITNPSSVESAVSQCAESLRGGCRWVQLRWKDAEPDMLTDAATRILPMCRQHDAIFIIDDHVQVARDCGADGVHLGKNDMSVGEARRILGPGFIIGATANEPEDIFAAAEQGADYIGYGPFRFTATKKNLSPVLGLEGYRRAVEACRGCGISLPIVAIGGITGSDIPAIMATGVNGIAVSGSIINAPDSAGATIEIIETIQNI